MNNELLTCLASPQVKKRNNIISWAPLLRSPRMRVQCNPISFSYLRDSVCPLHARDPCGGEDERGVLAALLIVQLPQPRVQVAPDVGDRQVGVSRPESNVISISTVVILATTSIRYSSEGN